MKPDMSLVTVAPFRAQDTESWDRFIRSSKNGTFLFLRGYMDYHGDRFEDHSLMFRSDGELVAVLPAHVDGEGLATHRGLTYGGVVSCERMGIVLMHAVFDALMKYLVENDFRALFYRTVPHIYHRIPAQEDLHALHKHGARLLRRHAISVVPSLDRPPMQRDRRAAIARASRAGLRVERSVDFAEFWPILERVLMEKFGSTPVHSLEEIELLHRRFPENIHLHLCRRAAEIVAGEVVFDTPRVMKLQYGCASAEGARLGAQDLLISELLKNYTHRTFFDFGTSLAADGASLNEGLVWQKEGFGGRTVCHDSYELAA
jgi:hypothetical protein